MTRSCRREPTRCEHAPRTRRATRPPPTGVSTGSRCCSRCRCGRRQRCRAGVEQRRVVRRTVRRGGKRHQVRRRITVLRPVGPRAPRRAGTHRRPAHRRRRQQGSRAPSCRCWREPKLRRSSPSALLKPGLTAATATRRAGTNVRTLRLVYQGSPLTLPAQAEVTVRVQAASSLNVSRPRGSTASGSCSADAFAAARTGRRQARRAAGSPLRPLADLPHAPHRPGRQVERPVPIPTHARHPATTGSDSGCRAKQAIHSTPGPHGR